MKKFKSRTKKVRELRELCRNINVGSLKKDEILKFSDIINSITPVEVISILESVIKNGSSMKHSKREVSKVLNIFHSGLKNYNWECLEDNKFLMDMMEENLILKENLTELKGDLKEFNLANSKDKKNYIKLIEKILIVEDIENHYRKIENVFFPYLEKIGGDLSCLPVMWSIHDDIRTHLRNLRKIKDAKENYKKEFNSIVGELFFSLYAMIFREELILYPAAQKIFSSEMWEFMYNESFDIGFSFIKKKRKKVLSLHNQDNDHSAMIDLGTGAFDIKVLQLVLNTLPVDITFVDENDKVAYFSHTADRIFPRSKSILGREVRNCHPPESLEKVNKIIESFRSGSSSKESFRIYHKDKYILIEYFAVRDNSGNFKGTLEVSTDITGITKLTGEKRL